MTTINQVISELRLQLGQWGYDDDNLLQSEEALYNLLNKAGATIYKRISGKFNKIPDWMFTTYPIPLEEVNEDVFPCEEIPDRCVILESTFTIPLALTSRNRSTLRVMWGNKELPQYNRTNQYDPILKSMPSYKIQNSKLRIYRPENFDAVKGVYVSAIWADVMEWQDKKYCPDTEETICHDLDELEYPLYSNPDYALMAYQLIAQQLGIVLQQENQNKPH